jgi:hypothetical protein
MSYGMSLLAKTASERDAAITRAEKAETDIDAIGAAHTALADQLNDAVRARDELGIQLAALKAEHARLIKGLHDIEGFMLREWRPPAEAVLAMVREVAAGGPAVPGDALAGKPQRARR